MPAYGVYEEKMCGLNGSSGGTGKFWMLHTVFENQSNKSHSKHLTFYLNFRGKNHTLLLYKAYLSARLFERTLI